MIKLFQICIAIVVLNTLFYPQSRVTANKSNLFFSPLEFQTIEKPITQIKQHLMNINKKQKIENDLRDYYFIDSLISTSVNNDSSKYIFEYEVNGKMREMIGLYKVSGEWQIFSKKEFFSDSINKPVREIDFSWNNGIWDSSFQILYEYNQEEQMITSTLQDYFTNNWRNIVRTIYNYDLTGNDTTALTEVWENNQWNNHQIVNSYYSLDNLKDSLLIQIWEQNNWVNFSKSSFHYNDITKFLELAIAEMWTGINWKNYLKLEITNDQYGNQIQHIDEIWNGSSWEKSVKRNFTYIHNYFESGYSEIWNGTNWVPGDNVILIKNPDGFKIGFITQSVYIYYIIVNVESEDPKIVSDYSLSQNYPNPFNPTTTINYQIPELSFVTLKVYDVLGNEVATLVNEENPTGSYVTEFNAEDLPSGVYFYRITTNNFANTKKMILLR